MWGTRRAESKALSDGDGLATWAFDGVSTRHAVSLQLGGVLFRVFCWVVIYYKNGAPSFRLARRA